MYNIRSVRGIFMALIECPECHQQVSDVAEVCPHCGYPIKNHVKVKQEVVDDHKKILGCRYSLFVCRYCLIYCWYCFNHN